MTTRIFRLICIAAYIVLAASLIILVGELYAYFTNVHYNSLQSETRIIAYGVEQDGVSFIEGLANADQNIIWISAEGEVIYDTSDDEVTKAESAAFAEARREGFGEKSQVLPTLTEKNVYSACRLNDGSVIVVSEKQFTFFSPMMGFVQRVVIIAIAAVILAFVLAKSFSARIVKPINSIDLDAPGSTPAYEELSPLLERIEAQRSELRRRQSEFEAATDNMREGLILIGGDGDILTANSAAASILGIERAEVSSDTLAGLNGFPELLSSACSGVRSETTFTSGSDSYKVIADPVMSDNAPAGAVIFIMSMTEKEKAEVLRREFTANVSHEMKTPLQSISGYAELIMNGMVKPDDIPKFGQRIYAESKRVTKLIDDIMKLSRLDEGALEMYRHDVDLLSAARTEMNALAPAMQECGVTAEVTGDKVFVPAFPALISAIFHNLFENAIKYNRENGSVTVTVKEQPDAAVVTVADTGIGIPPEHLDRVFERFYRVDKSRSKQVGGTGLGLAIVKHAVRLNNAHIGIESTVGSGTTVTVRFPK